MVYLLLKMLSAKQEKATGVKCVADILDIYIRKEKVRIFTNPKRKGFLKATTKQD
jgi:hypothetical protein